MINNADYFEKLVHVISHECAPLISLFLHIAGFQGLVEGGKKGAVAHAAAGLRKLPLDRGVQL